jgi:hypothetical protein
MVDVEDDGDFDGEIRRKVTRKTFKIEEVSALAINFFSVSEPARAIGFLRDELTRPSWDAADSAQFNFSPRQNFCTSPVELEFYCVGCVRNRANGL